jgi:hypothetical protein
MVDRSLPGRGSNFDMDDEEIRQAREILRGAEEDARRNAEARARNPPELTPMMKKFIRHDNASREARSYTPNDRNFHHMPNASTAGWYFFYGTLMDPEWLLEISELEEAPEMDEGTVERSRVKYWGPYPVVVESPNRRDTVSGVVCFIPTVDAVQRIRAYETDKYEETLTSVDRAHGPSIMCRMFTWRMGSQDECLTDEPSDD